MAELRPWLGVSSQNDSQWTVTVRDKLDDKEVFKEYTVAAVRGGQAVQWRESRAQRHVRILGLILQARGMRLKDLYGL